MSKRDYYEILSVEKTSSAEEIKKAYRQCALKYHPDRNPGDHTAEEKFKEASEAYEILSDSEKRSRYDRFGHAGLGGNGSGFRDVEDIFSSFGDIFEDFFGFSTSRRPRGRSQRGRDLSMEVEVSFEEACFGVEKKLEIERYETCGDCQGSGSSGQEGKKTCPQCRGTGQVTQSQGFFMVATTCPQCRGEGEIIAHPCKGCHGQGRTPQKKKLTVKVPAGIDDGNRLMVHGEGEAGVAGGGHGDLYLFIRVRPHKGFERDGTTIYSTVDVSFPTAALGGEIEVETLEGKTRIEIERGSNTGDTVVIEEAGVPYLKSSKKRGDHIVRLFVRVPKNVNAKQEELLREFASLSGETMGKKKKGFFS